MVMVFQKGHTPKHKGVFSDPQPRFWSKIDLDFESGCWNWTAGKTKAGYGQFTIKTKPVLIHRFSYELLKGKIPDGLELDHLCKNKKCANPDHLEAVSHKENTSRCLTAVSTINSQKTICPRGHSYSGNNLRITPHGHRICKKCMCLHMRNHREKIRNKELLCN